MEPSKKRLPFKKNMHLARRCRLGRIEMDIKIYNPKYPTPKYLTFIKEMLEDGWDVKIYEARVSKYLFLQKGDALYKIRFSNHKPLYEKEMENDCDYYVGISHKTVHTTDEITNLLKHKHATNPS